MRKEWPKEKKVYNIDVLEGYKASYIPIICIEIVTVLNEGLDILDELSLEVGLNHYEFRRDTGSLSCQLLP